MTPWRALLALTFKRSRRQKFSTPLYLGDTGSTTAGTGVIAESVAGVVAGSVSGIAASGFFSAVGEADVGAAGGMVTGVVTDGTAGVTGTAGTAGTAGGTAGAGSA